MTLTETRTFMEEIKAFYPKDFVYEDYLPRQWVTQLKDYSLISAKKDFENHKIGSMKEKPPTLTYFIKCFENSQKKKPGLFQCKYCKNTFKDLEEMHRCVRLCRSKKYIYKISEILKIDLVDIFGTIDLTQDVIDKTYKRFMYKAFVKQKELCLLDGKTADGLMLYYNQVLKPALEKAGKI